MKRTLCWLTLLCLLLAPALNALAEGGAPTIAEQTVNFYFKDVDTVLPIPVHFIGGSDVPYLALSDWQSVIDGLARRDADIAQARGKGSFQFNFSMRGNMGVLTREDGHTAEFDCDADAVRFTDYDAFLRLDRDSLLTDMVGIGESGPDEPVRYLRRSIVICYQRCGGEVTLNAADYGIDFIAEGGRCYVPMQTLSDLLLCNLYCAIYWNGEIAVVGPPDVFGDSDALTPLGEKYYSVEPRARSEAMARFSYGELCLALDAMYGLKENHGIDRFDTLFGDTGMKADLSGTDTARASAALHRLFQMHLDDLHSTYILPSPLAGVHAADNYPTNVGYGLSNLSNYQEEKRYRKARAAVWPDGVPGYEEVGNTAFITFDNFRDIPDGVDYYETPPTAATTGTFGILIYAYSRITRPDSPIENVVLDLSCNLGGDPKAAIYTLAAFLGTGSLSTRNTLSGARVTGNYDIDINLDHKADKDDQKLLDMNLFCLESPASFSCANLVACAFRNSGRVALLGRTSGGGTCFVQAFSTADGACCELSSAVQMCLLKNGAFYDIDRGAEPDFPLVKPASFYDREALAEYINEIR